MQVIGVRAHVVHVAKGTLHATWSAEHGDLTVTLGAHLVHICCLSVLSADYEQSEEGWHFLPECSS